MRVLSDHESWHKLIKLSFPVYLSFHVARQWLRTYLCHSAKTNLWLFMPGDQNVVKNCRSFICFLIQDARSWARKRNSKKKWSHQPQKGRKSNRLWHRQGLFFQFFLSTLRDEHENVIYEKTSFTLLNKTNIIQFSLANKVSRANRKIGGKGSETDNKYINKSRIINLLFPRLCSNFLLVETRKFPFFSA